MSGPILQQSKMMGSLFFLTTLDGTIMEPLLEEESTLSLLRQLRFLVEGQINSIKQRRSAHLGMLLPLFGTPLRVLAIELMRVLTLRFGTKATLLLLQIPLTKVHPIVSPDRERTDSIKWFVLV